MASLCPVPWLAEVLLGSLFVKYLPGAAGGRGTQAGRVQGRGLGQVEALVLGSWLPRTLGRAFWELCAGAEEVQARTQAQVSTREFGHSRKGG